MMAAAPLGKLNACQLPAAVAAARAGTTTTTCSCNADGALTAMTVQAADLDLAENRFQDPGEYRHPFQVSC